MIVLALLAPIGVLAFLAVCAARFGYDSRDGFEDPPQSWFGAP